jgi:phospholipid/cholesterol/gamma-HCH transport system ATP-binding protein
MIELKGVQIAFEGVPLLTDISFTLGPGERVSLVGPGGCGKSTILKILLGLLRPDAGEVRLLDMDMTRSKETERLKVLKKVGMAFQQGALFDFMTVRENLLFAMSHMTSMTAEEMAARVKELLTGVKLGHTMDMFPYELSGGMQRRVGIARALGTSPVVAIFDEPTSGLDPVTSTIILNMVLALSTGGQEAAQMVVTSNVEIGIRFAERILVVNEGRIVADGAWQELLLSGPPWVQHFLGVRLIGLDLEYAHELRLPKAFIEKHWRDSVPSRHTS